MSRLDKAAKDPNVRYCDKLESPWRERYLKKIKFIVGRDPMVLEDIKTWERIKAVDFFPSITYMDIVNYLLFATSTYTKEELKAYKGLDAYNLFLCGWVSDKAVYLCKDDKHVAVAGRVMHSQSLREKALRPWIVAEHEGAISFCHCNCKAGLGEVCTHAAALLFAIQASVQIRDACTVTGRPAYWKLPPEMKKIEYNAIWEIDLTSAKALFKRFNESLTSPQPLRYSQPIADLNNSAVDDVVPTDEELQSFCTTLFDTGTKPAVLSTMEPFCQSYIPDIISNIYPSFLSEVYTKSLLTATHAELVAKSRTVLDELSVDAEQARCVEEATRDQYRTKMWYSFRCGRVTASKAKSVCRTKSDNPSKSLIKAICYPEITRFTSKATRWGCRHEEEACKEFQLKVSPYHEGLHVSPCGLFLSTEHPFLGASPDGIVTCNCCGTFLLEVKCPFCVRYSCLTEKTPECLSMVNGQLRLDHDHAYYYQVQTQMGVVGNDISYFVVWTEQDIHIERIAFNEEMFRDICVKSEAFFTTALLPELLGKFYTRKQQEILEVGQDLLSHDTDAVSDGTVLTANPGNSFVACSQINTMVTPRVIIIAKRRLNPSTQNCPVQPSLNVALVDTLRNAPVTSQLLKPANRQTAVQPTTLTNPKTLVVASSTDGDESDTKTLWCHCRRGDFGRMIGCDNDACPFQWFHYRCVGICRKPVGDWYCKDCSQKMTDEKEN